MRTGLLGGTFNPPHLGHLHAARLAQQALGLDRVLFIPTNIPPHKALPEDTATAADRCEMVRRMTADQPWARLDTIEIDRGGASYTVDTLRALHARGEEDLYLIVGTDMLLSFDRIWRAPEEIARLSTLAVCAREEEDWPALARKAETLRRELHAKIEMVRGGSLPISSTELRQGGALRRYTAPAVADYIEQHHLYGY
ncbi:MAG: nicotinate (nicotinamide) nucleotide adenylyltransferase [Agathobaculum desmolans]|uniref:nicotinate (nicotinamide) nucleotide adenylyltransferase n=1 Tax=Agathobaculum desmolans TaxID=39484 RepID=UPI0004E1702C|nr:nicotinate (nicotinamide) nucleotide adenylyltransferase [Agathobaculum desmolans]